MAAVGEVPVGEIGPVVHEQVHQHGLRADGTGAGQIADSAQDCRGRRWGGTPAGPTGS